MGEILSEHFGIFDYWETDAVFYFFKFKCADDGDGCAFGWVFAWKLAWLGKFKRETLRTTGEGVLDNTTEKTLVCFFIEIARKGSFHFDALADVFLRVGDHLVDHRIDHGTAHTCEVNIGIAGIFLGECRGREKE